jgi:hypothetical protein
MQLGNWALPEHIHLHLMGARFTELKQGPFLCAFFAKFWEN